ncbi:MAG: hypothetical protein NC548_59795 [Lachnospiraceae bacterium]|nr:hypothetical protein [Lachnospiraceae bacterium]
MDKDIEKKFIYVDEVDKSFGLAGMAISLTAWDKHDMISSITLDAEGEDSSITFSPEFFFSQNPRMSARIAWNELVKQYQMFVGMVIGNIMCRKTAGKNDRMGEELASDIYSLVEDEGLDLCSLEKDEIEIIFNKTYNFLSDFFSDSRMAAAADRFASDLRLRRSMSTYDIEDELRLLHF